MAKWHPTDGTEVEAEPVESEEFQLIVEEIALILYKGFCRTKSDPTKTESLVEKTQWRFEK